MTTIKAAPPVETPAGLVVALPPCETCAPNSGGVIQRQWPDGGLTVWPCTDCSLPDVFALAVPCPTCGGIGWYNRPGLVIPDTCEACNGSGWVHHADYRVLEVLPIRLDGYDDDPAFDNNLVYIGIEETGEAGLLVIFYGPDEEYCKIDHALLPGAVPGGVALVVERVEP